MITIKFVGWRENVLPNTVVHAVDDSRQQGRLQPTHQQRILRLKDETFLCFWWNYVTGRNNKNILLFMKLLPRAEGEFVPHDASHIWKRHSQLIMTVGSGTEKWEVKSHNVRIQKKNFFR